MQYRCIKKEGSFHLDQGVSREWGKVIPILLSSIVSSIYPDGTKYSRMNLVKFVEGSL